MTEDARFKDMGPRGSDCLNCALHLFTEQEGVMCNHPQRPNAPAPVIRWFRGCPQHVPMKDPK